MKTANGDMVMTIPPRPKLKALRSSNVDRVIVSYEFGSKTPVGPYPKTMIVLAGVGAIVALRQRLKQPLVVVKEIAKY
jgi:hypothetical protein